MNATFIAITINMRKQATIITILVLLFCMQTFATQAQLDVIHRFSPLHSRDNNQVLDHYIYLSTPVLTPFTVTITDGSGAVLATPTISNASPFTYTIGSGQVPGTQIFLPIDSLNRVLKRSGLILSAPQKFYANLRVRAASQAESFTSKGTAAAGTTFRVGGFPQATGGNSTDRNFTAGIMATEDNTTVTFSDYDPAIVFAGNPTVSAPTITVTLNAGECYLLSGYSSITANLSGFIGALVQADKPIILTNGNLLGNIHPTSNSRDMGLDQSVPVDRLGKDHILIEGNGLAEMEQPIVIAHYNNTEIYINGSATPITTIQAGDYYLVPNADFQGTPHRNMLIHTSEPAYVYQAIAGSNSEATGGLNFIPPFNCFLPDSIDFIPSIDLIGATVFTGGLMIFTQQGATLQINGVTQTGAVAVPSVPWETYKITGITGHTTITSTAAVAAGIFGSSANAGFAGYFSGFSSNPTASDYSYADTCIASATQFTSIYDQQVPIDGVAWDFGDPGSGAGNTSTLENPQHTFSGPGTYTVRLIVFRCENDTVYKTIHISPLPTPASVGQDQNVCDVTATLSGNTALAGTGTWTLISGTGNITDPSNPVSQVTSLGVGNNTFQWTITSTPCPASAIQLIIARTAPPTASDAGIDQSICSATVALAGNVPATGTGTWTLISGSGTIADPSSATSGVTGLGVGPNTFEWTIANSPCPSSATQVIITRAAVPTTSLAGSDQSICSNTVALQGNIAATGTGVWTLISGAGTITAPSSPTSQLTGLGVGNNTFQWTISNAPCPASSSQVIIARADVPTVSNAGTAQTVCDNVVTLNGNAPTVGTGTWSVINGSGTFANANSPTTGVTGLGIGANTFQWTITNSPCPASTSQVIISTSTLDVNIQAFSPELCDQNNGTAVAASSGASGTVTYVWMPGNLSGAAQNALSSGTYTVTGTDNLGCTANATVVIANEFADVNAGSDITVCSGNAITLTATGTEQFSWTGSVTNGVPFVPLATQTYTVTGTNANGCTDTDNVTVTVIPSPVSSFNADVTTGYPGQQVNFTNASINGTTYTWNYGNGSGTSVNNLQNVQSAYPNTGTYEVILTAVNQTCVDSSTILITILPFPDPQIHVPNVFTPNGDKANDLFSITATYSESVEVEIYNRWGGLMEKLDNAHPEWDGSKASEGVYFFLYTVKGLNGNVITGQGFVTLIGR